MSTATKSLLHARYVAALKSYLKKRNEVALLAAYEVGKAFQAQQVPPEVLLEAHMLALDELPNLAKSQVMEAFSVLLEAMMAYGIAHGDAYRLLEHKNHQMERSSAALAAAREVTAALTASNQELHHLDQMRNQFIGIISHELRTPLNFITGFSSLVADETLGPLNVTQRGAMNKVLEGSDRLESIIEELLDANKLQAGKLDVRVATVDYAALIASLVAASQPGLDYKRLTLVPPAGPTPDVMADADRLHQVLRNLLSNAIKFTPEGGKIQLYVELTPAGRVLTRVEDSGIGISPEEVERVFRAFHQVDSTNTRQQGGTGLGLSIARSLVEAMGGTMGVMSELNVGSSFWFELPAALES
ncbi:MAG: histidine kinase [Cyanobacteria bacterium RYN_339]|nr:histidine kinase [Cyanobacteria bacterium RYN_339]